MFTGRLEFGYAATHIILTIKIITIKNMIIHDFGSKYSKPKYSMIPDFFLRSGI